MRRRLIALGGLSAVIGSLGFLRLPYEHATPLPEPSGKRDPWKHRPGYPQKIAGTTNPRFVWFQSDGVYSVLTESLGYRIEMTGNDFSVPAGFVTDYASVPQLVQWVIPKIGPHTVPAVIHDYLYWDQTCTREEADKIMYSAMEEYGASLPSRLLVYLGLRAGAGWAWADNAKEKATGLPRIVPRPRQDPPIAGCPVPQERSWVPLNVSWVDFRKSLPPQTGPVEGAKSFEPLTCKLPETTLFQRYWHAMFR